MQTESGRQTRSAVARPRSARSGSRSSMCRRLCWWSRCTAPQCTAIGHRRSSIWRIAGLQSRMEPQPPKSQVRRCSVLHTRHRHPAHTELLATRSLYMECTACTGCLRIWNSCTPRILPAHIRCSRSKSHPPSLSMGSRRIAVDHNPWCMARRHDRCLPCTASLRNQLSHTPESCNRRIRGSTSMWAAPTHNEQHHTWSRRRTCGRQSAAVAPPRK